MRKRHIVNPRKSGPIHGRRPSAILRRAIRGMLQHKSSSGKSVISRLSLYEGVPIGLQRCERFVVPNALRAVSLKPDSKYCVVKVRFLATDFGLES